MHFIVVHYLGILLPFYGLVELQENLNDFILRAWDLPCGSTGLYKHELYWRQKIVTTVVENSFHFIITCIFINY
jgi:hypothetical protein